MIILNVSCNDVKGSCRCSNKSSAYKLNLCFELVYCIPLILLFCRMAVASGSMKTANRDGESGHPCLVPWWSVKLGEVIPFVVTVALGEVYSVLIQWMNDSEAKPVEGGK